MTFLLVTAVALSWVGVCLATDSEAQMAARMIAHINAARLAPAATAAQYGAGPEAVAALENLSFAALGQNALLDSAAAGHREDMLANGYFSRESLDGRSPEDRIAAAGYAAGASGETIAVVTFQNFIAPQTAVDLLFSRMLRAEAESGNPTGQNILNPGFTEIGIAIRSGVLRVEGVAYNVYLAVCDFAALDESLAAQRRALVAGQIELLVNQERAGDALSSGRNMSPLSRAADLDRVAADLAMDETVDLSLPWQPIPVSLESSGIDPAAYEPGSVQAFISTHAFTETPDDNALAGEIFKDLVSGADDPDNFLAAQLFGLSADSVGLDLRSESVWVDGQYIRRYTMVWILASKQFTQAGAIMGVAFQDANANGRFDPGEGVSKLAVLVYGAGFHLRTDEAGAFGAEVESGYYWAVLFQQDGSLQIKDVNHSMQTNTWVMMPLAAGEQ